MFVIFLTFCFFSWGVFIHLYKTKEKIFKAIENDDKFEKYELEFDWKPIYEEIINPKTENNPIINFPKIDKKKIKDILLKYEFSEKRIDSQLDKLDNLKKQKEQNAEKDQQIHPPNFQSEGAE